MPSLTSTTPRRRKRTLLDESQPTIGGDNGFARTYDKASGKWVRPKEQSSATLDIVGQPDLSSIVSQDLAKSIQAGQYGLPDDIIQKQTNLALTPLDEAMQKAFKQVKLDAESRGAFFGDANTAGQFDVAKETSRAMGDAQAKIAIDAAQRAAQEQQATRQQAIGLGESMAGRQEDARRFDVTQTGIIDGQETLAAKELATRTRQEDARIAIAEDQQRLAETNAALQRALSQGEATGQFVDPVTGQTRQTLQAQAQAFQQRLAQAQVTGVLPGEGDVGADGLPIIGGTGAQGGGVKTLEAQRLDEQKRQFDAQQKLAETNAALERAVAQSRATGQYIDPVTGQAGETLEAELQRGQLALQKGVAIGEIDGQQTLAAKELAQRGELEQQRIDLQGESLAVERERLEQQANQWASEFGLRGDQFIEDVRRYNEGATFRDKEYEEGIRRFDEQLSITERNMLLAEDTFDKEYGEGGFKERELDIKEKEAEAKIAQLKYDMYVDKFSALLNILGTVAGGTAVEDFIKELRKNFGLGEGTGGEGNPPIPKTPTGIAGLSAFGTAAGLVAATFALGWGLNRLFGDGRSDEQQAVDVINRFSGMMETGYTEDVLESETFLNFMQSDTTVGGLKHLVATGASDADIANWLMTRWDKEYELSQRPEQTTNITRTAFDSDGDGKLTAAEGRAYSQSLAFIEKIGKELGWNVVNSPAFAAFMADPEIRKELVGIAGVSQAHDDVIQNWLLAAWNNKKDTYGQEGGNPVIGAPPGGTQPGNQTGNTGQQPGNTQPPEIVEFSRPTYFQHETPQFDAAFNKQRGQPGYVEDYDFNRDGIINFDDWQVFASVAKQLTVGEAGGTQRQDGMVELADGTMVPGSLFTTTQASKPAAQPTIGVPPSAVPNVGNIPGYVVERVLAYLGIDPSRAASLTESDIISMANRGGGIDRFV